MAFRREGDVLRCQLDPVEQMLISSLVEDLIEALEPPASSAPPDPLAVELGLTDLSADSAPVISDNPVLARLLPDAYDDPVAAAEFRRYTDESLRLGKISAAQTLLAGIAEAASDPDGWVSVDEGAADLWLRAINDLRLALGVQLGLDSESPEKLASLPESDPRHGAAMLYDFLTWWQDGLVVALTGD